MENQNKEIRNVIFDAAPSLERYMVYYTANAPLITEETIQICARFPVQFENQQRAEKWASAFELHLIYNGECYLLAFMSDDTSFAQLHQCHIDDYSCITLSENGEPVGYCSWPFETIYKSAVYPDIFTDRTVQIRRVLYDPQAMTERVHLLGQPIGPSFRSSDGVRHHAGSYITWEECGHKLTGIVCYDPATLNKWTHLRFQPSDAADDASWDNWYVELKFLEPLNNAPLDPDVSLLRKYYPLWRFVR